MHKTFYASGFLYHLPSQQILLRQGNKEIAQGTSVFWSFIGGHSKAKEDDKKAFERVMKELLGIKLDPKRIFSVYDYFHTTLKTNHFVVYAEITDAKLFKPSKDHSFAWFSQKQISKLPFVEQTKHDMIVAQRVINKKSRDIEEKLNPKPIITQM